MDTKDKVNVVVCFPVVGEDRSLIRTFNGFDAALAGVKVLIDEAPDVVQESMYIIISKKTIDELNSSGKNKLLENKPSIH